MILICSHITGSYKMTEIIILAYIKLIYLVNIYVLAM